MHALPCRTYPPVPSRAWHAGGMRLLILFFQASRCCRRLSSFVSRLQVQRYAREVEFMAERHSGSLVLVSESLPSSHAGDYSRSMARRCRHKMSTFPVSDVSTLFRISCAGVSNFTQKTIFQALVPIDCACVFILTYWLTQIAALLRRRDSSWNSTES